MFSFDSVKWNSIVTLIMLKAIKRIMELIKRFKGTDITTNIYEKFV